MPKRFMKAVAVGAMLCGCAIVPGRNRHVDFSRTPSDSIPERMTEGYYYTVLTGRSDSIWASQIGDSCIGIFPLLLLRDRYFKHSAGRIGGAGCDYPNKTFETPEEGHAQIQASLHGDSLLYSLDGWGSYSLSGNGISVGVFITGDMFSIAYYVKRGHLSGDSLALSSEGHLPGEKETLKYHFRAHPLHIDYGKIPLKKRRFESKSLPPVWFWWEG